MTGNTDPTETEHEAPERFWSDLDLDDIAESFIGSLAAGLVLLLVAWVCMRRRDACRDDAQQRSR